MTTLRALGAIRLSKVADESTSPARQRERIAWWVSGNDAELVDVTSDLGVSGAVSPFEREGLGEYLTDARADEWDVLLALKLDRISRSAEDTHKLLRWCTERGKRIVTTDDGIDTETANGKVFIQLASVFAEVERTSIQERVLASREKLRRDGRWGGGPPVYGLMAVARDDGPGYRIERDPDAYPHLRWIVERVIAGDSLNSIATTLNERGVAAPSDQQRIRFGKPTRGAQWRTNAVTGILTSLTLRGYMSHNGEVVRSPDGMPIKAGEPVVTLSEWKQLQARLVDGIIPRTRTEGTSLLLHIAFCAECGSKLYRQRAVKRGKEYAYYRCREVTTGGKGCSSRSIKAERLEYQIGQLVMDEIGEVEVTRKVLVPERTTPPR